jgi:hypothetical protein
MNPELLDRARYGLRNGTLPSDISRVFGGTSAGGTCPLCGAPIFLGTVEIELESEATNLEVSLHPECHLALVLARQMVQSEEAVSALPYGFPW